MTHVLTSARHVVQRGARDGLTCRASGGGGRRGARAGGPSAAAIARDKSPVTNRGDFMTLALPRPSRDHLPACFPHALTGVTFAGLHGVNMSLKGADLVAVRDAVSAALSGLQLSPCARGIWTYEQRIRDEHTGAFIAWTDGRDDMAVSLTGTACELVGTDGILALVRRLAGLAGDGFRVTRLDVAWDTELFTVADVARAYAVGNCVTRSRSHDYKQNGKGSTFYIGKRGEKNARLVRFYDKRGPVRCELELHDERATGLAAYLVGEGADVATLCLGALVDFVDFRDVGADSNVTRCPRLDWWHAFVRDAEALPLPVATRLPTLDSVADWLHNQVASSLAVVADAYGAGYIRQLIEHGRERRTPRQSVLLDMTQQVKAAATQTREQTRQFSEGLAQYAFYRH